MADEQTKSTKAVEKPSPEWKGSLSADEELEAPDGHVTLSADDIEARQ